LYLYYICTVYIIVDTDVVADLGSPPKKKAPVVVDLTLSDSDDDTPAPTRVIESVHPDSSVKRNFSGTIRNASTIALPDFIPFVNNGSRQLKTITSVPFTYFCPYKD
jgi:hypothetical protein